MFFFMWKIIKLNKIDLFDLWLYIYFANVYLCWSLNELHNLVSKLKNKYLITV